MGNGIRVTRRDRRADGIRRNFAISVLWCESASGTFLTTGGGWVIRISMQLSHRHLHTATSERGCARLEERATYDVSATDRGDCGVRAPSRVPLAGLEAADIPSAVESRSVLGVGAVE